MKLVIDASVALKWFLRGRPDEPDGDAALEILRGHVEGRYALLQPPHFLAEMCAVLARESPATSADDLRDLLELAIPQRDDAALYARAMRLSQQLGHHLFDTLYHALALEERDTVLVTADERYLAKAAGQGCIVALARWTPG